jgi:DNA-binding response OmpR family regulator
MALKDSILIVDDEPKLARSLSLILQRADYVVTTAPDAATALQLLQVGAYNLVFLDIRLPDQSGIQLLPQIHAIYPDMPVVMVTAHATLETAIGAVRAGARDYLLKPIDPEDILARTKKILDEQVEPKRKREITAQIQSLLSELQTTHDKESLASASNPAPPALDPTRYLKRGDLQLDLHTRIINLNDREICLPPSTFDYLVTLVRHSPNPVAYNTLVKESQGYQELGRIEAKEITRWQIHELRKVLEQDLQHPHMIITVRDVGYRLIV